MFFNNPSLVNAAYVAEEGKISLNSGFRFRTGIFKKIATYSFSGDLAIRRPNRSVHVVRAIFFNEKDGPYIEKPRGYFNYVYQLPLSEETSIAAGIILGGAGIYFSAPSATAEGSVVLPDGAAGLDLKHKSIHLGISTFQIFNSRSSPVSAPIRFGRYYTMTLAAEKDISPTTTIKLNALYRLLPAAANELISAISFSFSDILMIGTSVNNLQGASFFITVKADREKERVVLSFAYDTPLIFSKASWANSIEITAAFVMK
jgi:hypothetical protein